MECKSGAVIRIEIHDITRNRLPPPEQPPPAGPSSEVLRQPHVEAAMRLPSQPHGTLARPNLSDIANTLDGTRIEELI